MVEVTSLINCIYRIYVTLNCIRIYHLCVNYGSRDLGLASLKPKIVIKDEKQYQNDMRSRFLNKVIH